jgi:DNA polymerase III delta prime subunit
MFLNKSYIPLTFEDSLIHKTIIKKFKDYSNNSLDIIFYGNNGTGKYILSQLFLESIFGLNIYKKKKYNDMPNYLYSNYHYEIYLSRTYDKGVFKKFILDLCINKNIVTNLNNIILIKNAHYLENDIILFMKTLIEQQNPVSFILISNTISHLPDSFKNLFFKERVPTLNKKELFDLINSICEKENIDMTFNKKEELISITEHNISKIMLNIQFYKKTQRFLTYTNNQIDAILNLVYEKKNENILKIREKIYDLTSKNINKDFLIKYALKKVLSKIDCDTKKMSLIKEVAHIDQNLKHSYKDLIHIEYFFILLMKYI